MSAGAYLFLEKVVDHQHIALASACLVAGALTTLGFVALSKLKNHSNPVIPDETLTIRNLFELLAQFIMNLGDNLLGKENRKYYPFLATIFTYILFSNFLGLLPGFIMPTDSMAFNFGIAIIAFIAYNAWGIRESGVLNYFKHFLGPVWWLAPLLLPIELISHLFRPVTLTLRLFGNMTGDHIVLSVFTKLTENVFIPIPVVFYFFGTFVCILQAFIFTLLTMIYIRLAVVHEGEHH